MTSVADFRERMWKQGLRALFLLVLVVLQGCQDRPAALHSLQGATMGTTWSVKTVGLPPGVSVEQLHSDITLLLESVNNQMSTWQPDSDISAFNTAEPGSWQQLPPDFFRVLDYALWLAGETDGAYDPTVGPLVNLWGFGPDREAFSPPSPERIAEARQRTGWRKLELDPERRAVRQPGGVYLDLSSVAKGYAVDKISDFLAARGLEAFLVEIGGELRGRGTKPGGQPWRVAIEQPLRGERRPDKVVALTDLAIATSGDYRNFREVDGELLSHTIDPRTGRPVKHRLALVTVLAGSCMEADALATALLALGPGDGLEFARQRELAVRFVVRTDEGFNPIVTDAFQRHTSEVATP